MPRFRLTVSAAFVLLALVRSPLVAVESPAAARDTSDVQERIARVEAGLTPPVRVSGEPVRQHRLVRRMAFHGVPGVSVAVVHAGEVEWTKAWGRRTPSGDLLTTRTLFQGASISKPVTALAILGLAQTGALSLDENVEAYLDGWRLSRVGSAAGDGTPITLESLLRHTAGTTVHGFRGYARGQSVPTLEDVLDGKGGANSPRVVVDTPPGTAWRYSGGGYTLAQLVVEHVTDRRFEDVMATVLRRVGMTHSTFRQPLPASRADSAAVGFRAGGRPVTGGWRTYPEMAAAGLWTTPTDIARFALEVSASLSGEPGAFLTRETARRMLTPGPGSWGLGPEVRGNGLDLRFEHDGANEGFRARFVMFPRRGLGAVVMTNSDTGEELIDEIIRSIANEYGWPGFAPRVVAARPLAARDGRSFAGVYRIATAPDVEVRVAWRAGRLRMSIAGGPARRLIPVGEDRFVVESDGQTLHFERDRDGRVTAVNAYGSRAHRVRRPRR